MKHLDYFTVEMLQSEPISGMIPKLVEEVEEDHDETNSVAYHLLQNYTEQPPSYSLVL